MAILLGIGAGCLIGVGLRNPDGGFFTRTAVAIGAGALVGGGVLLLVLFFGWAGRFADPDTLRKYLEPDRPSTRPRPEKETRQRGGVLAVLAKVGLALFIGAGVGCIVGGGVALFSSPAHAGYFGLLLGAGVGMIVFAGTAFAWLFDNEPESGKQRKAHVSQKETPISRGELPQETGPWQPHSEHAR
jgi:hypothetical protein